MTTIPPTREAIRKISPICQLLRKVSIELTVSPTSIDLPRGCFSHHPEEEVNYQMLRKVLMTVFTWSPISRSSIKKLIMKSSKLITKFLELWLSITPPSRISTKIETKLKNKSKERALEIRLWQVSFNGDYLLPAQKLLTKVALQIPLRTNKTMTLDHS